MSMTDERPTSKERAEDLLFREFLYKGVGLGWTLRETVEHLKAAAKARGILFTGHRKVLWFHGDHPKIISGLEELMGALADNMFGPDVSSGATGESAGKIETYDKGKGKAKA